MSRRARRGAESETGARGSGGRWQMHEDEPPCPVTPAVTKTNHILLLMSGAAAGEISRDEI